MGPMGPMGPMVADWYGWLGSIPWGQWGHRGHPMGPMDWPLAYRCHPYHPTYQPGQHRPMGSYRWQADRDRSHRYHRYYYGTYPIRSMGVLVPMVAVDGFALEGLAKKEGPLSLPIGALFLCGATIGPIGAIGTNGAYLLSTASHWPP